jgi:DNA-binding NtrC family response regulator
LAHSTKFGEKTLTTTTNKKIRILLVDDEEDILLILKNILELHEFQVDSFASSMDALSKFRPSFYNLLIVDIRMPGMNGFELFSKIRDVDSKVKVCFLTAFETYRDEFKRQFPQLDEVKCYIKKPVSASALIKHVENILELH